MDIGYSGLKLFMIFKNINFTLFIYNIRVKGLLNKRLNCHKKSFTFSFLLPLSNSTKVNKDHFLTKTKRRFPKTCQNRLKVNFLSTLDKFKKGQNQV